MGELKIIDEYYTNLEYENNDKKALILALSEKIEFADVNNFSERFLKAASVIKKNLSLFQSACDHVDTITTIIEYLSNIGMKFTLDKYDKEYKEDDIVLSVIFTLLNIYNIRKGHTIQLFLENVIIKKSVLDKSFQYTYLLFSGATNHNNEIIVLADSDLYAVISYFRNKKYVLSFLNKIWVQEPIKEKFLWLMKEYLEDLIDYPIYTFRKKKELFTKAGTSKKINIISIWTEDIVFAKNLAMSLNRDVVFINSYMDFYGGIILLPYIKIFDKTLHKWCNSNLDDCKKTLSMHKHLVYNLFYDGMWQQPIKATYWIHNNCQMANATSEDVNRCISSAKKGFKIWSAKSVTCRMQILSKFASIIECNGKSDLATLILTWIKMSFYENSLFCSQSEELEVTKIPNPKGIIILKEEEIPLKKDEFPLFTRMIQILTAGNSVIVINNTNSCNLAPYYNIFSAAGIPPGVINLLSNENIQELELALCGTDYASYAKQFVPISQPRNPEKMFMNFTTPKYIIFPLKQL
ncbi:PREDICTED: uncharacterized protein LOC105457345 [Wasmannia auropunctata]|uniref:uncharacterized protein LOC105457345 n=1 Tax=Wasmannia auropunctata TaxID=64793 RepID=UPI0005ED4494|nr:PREDICTED: uncharacterized protein LOC105457345 [Wasmannia auropunctata]